VLLGSPFSAAENALIPSILEGELYPVGTGLRTITGQMAQLIGFAAGGLVTAAISPRGGLAVDAASFAASALLLGCGLQRRPAPGAAAGELSRPRRYLASIGAGARLVASDRRLRILLGLGWLAAFFVVPEGVAVPYAAELGGGATASGLLMASMPAGTALGTFAYIRFVSPEARLRWMGPLAFGTSVPLVLCVFHPGLVGSLVLWTLSGAFGAYQAQVYAEYARSIPDARRGQAVGIASSGLLAVQGVGILLGGVVAGGSSPSLAVGLAGSVEAVLAAVLATGWWRLRSRPGGGRGVEDLVISTRGESD
jgi:hypothetical protein